MKHLVLIAALFTISSVYASPHRQTQPQQFQQQRSKTPQRFRKSFKSPEIKKPTYKQPKRHSQPRNKKKFSQRKPSSPNLLWSSYSGVGYTINYPETWQCIDDKTQLPEKLDAVFIGRGIGQLTPTINLAQEITSKGISEYVEEVLTYHKTQDTTLESSIFTHIQSQSGEFTIIKTEKNSSWGRVYCLQAIAVLNHTAYILTSTTTLADYPELSLIFFKAVASFSLEASKIPSGDAILEEALKKFKEETLAH